MTGNRSGHLLRSDIEFSGTICLGKYPGKFLCPSVFNENRGSSITSLANNLCVFDETSSSITSDQANQPCGTIQALHLALMIPENVYPVILYLRLPVALRRVNFDTVSVVGSASEQ